MNIEEEEINTPDPIDVLCKELDKKNSTLGIDALVNEIDEINTALEVELQLLLMSTLRGGKKNKAAYRSRLTKLYDFLLPKLEEYAESKRGDPKRITLKANIARTYCFFFHANHLFNIIHQMKGFPDNWQEKSIDILTTYFSKPEEFHRENKKEDENNYKKDFMELNLYQGLIIFLRQHALKFLYDKTKAPQDSTKKQIENKNPSFSLCLKIFTRSLDKIEIPRFKVDCLLYLFECRNLDLLDKIERIDPNMLTKVDFFSTTIPELLSKIPNETPDNREKRTISRLDKKLFAYYAEITVICNQLKEIKGKQDHFLDRNPSETLSKKKSPYKPIFTNSYSIKIDNHEAVIKHLNILLKNLNDLKVNEYIKHIDFREVDCIVNKIFQTHELITYLKLLYRGCYYSIHCISQEFVKKLETEKKRPLYYFEYLTLSQESISHIKELDGLNNQRENTLIKASEEKLDIIAKKIEEFQHEQSTHTKLSKVLLQKTKAKKPSQSEKPDTTETVSEEKKKKSKKKKKTSQPSIQTTAVTEPPAETNHSSSETPDIAPIDPTHKGSIPEILDDEPESPPTDSSGEINSFDTSSLNQPEQLLSGIAGSLDSEPTDESETFTPSLTVPKMTREISFKLYPTEMPLPLTFKEIESIFKLHGIHYDVVGGAVRDFKKNKPPRDIDVIARHPKIHDRETLLNELLSLLKSSPHLPTAKIQGTQHPIINIESEPPIQISAFSYTDYTLVNEPHDPNKSSIELLFQDVKRRSLIRDTLVYDPEAGVIIDFFGAIEDVEKKRFRIINIDKMIPQEIAHCFLRIFRFMGQEESEAYDLEALKIIKDRIDILQHINKGVGFHEIKKLLEGGYAFSTWKLLKNQGFSRSIFPLPAGRNSSIHSLMIGRVFEELDRNVHKKKKEYLTLLAFAVIFFGSLQEQFESRKGEIQESAIENMLVKLLNRPQLIFRLPPVVINNLKEIFIDYLIKHGMRTTFNDVADELQADQILTQLKETVTQFFLKEKIKVPLANYDRGFFKNRESKYLIKILINDYQLTLTTNEELKQFIIQLPASKTLLGPDKTDRLWDSVKFYLKTTLGKESFTFQRKDDALIVSTSETKYAIAEQWIRNLFDRTANRRSLLGELDVLINESPKR